MARYSMAGRATIAGSSTLPLVSLYSPAGSGGAIREIGLFNTTSTALAVAVVRLSTTGTQGAALTEAEYQEDAQPPLMTGFAGHTVGPTIVAGVLRQASLGASIGSGVIWTFGDSGLVIQPGTGNGIGIIIPTGTGQVLDYYIDWDE